MLGKLCTKVKCAIFVLILLYQYNLVGIKLNKFAKLI